MTDFSTVDVRSGRVDQLPGNFHRGWENQPKSGSGFIGPHEICGFPSFFRWETPRLSPRTKELIDPGLFDDVW